MDQQQEAHLGEPIQAEFFNRCVDEVAAKLIGSFCFVKRNGVRIGGQIVETEAYCQFDPAAHSYNKEEPGQPKETKMNKAMFSPAAYMYIYPNSPKGYCHLNFVCREAHHHEPFGSAVLIRALHPTDGICQMKENRRRNFAKPDGPLKKLWNLCSGPIKLCQALDIRYDGNDKQPISGILELYNRKGNENVSVYCDARIGIPKDCEGGLWSRRYVWKGSQFLSKPIKGGTEFTQELLNELRCLRTSDDLKAVFKKRGS